MIKSETFCVCDLCKRRDPKGIDSINAVRTARVHWWLTIPLGYGNELHYCPECKLLGEDKLLAKIGLCRDPA